MEEEVEVCAFHDVGISYTRGWWRQQGGDSGWVLTLAESGCTRTTQLDPPGVYALDGMLKYGEKHAQCPYFTARRIFGGCSE